MAENTRVGYSSAPGFLQFDWITSGIPRRHRINVRPGTAVVGGNNTVIPRNETPQPIQDAVNFYMQIVSFLNDSGFANASWEFYTQSDEDSLPVLVQAGQYTDPVPLITGNASNLGMTVYTLSFRSTTNGRGKLVYSGCVPEANQRFATSVPITDVLGSAFLGYLLGASCILTAPDGGYPLAIRGITTKTNDELLKKRRGD